MITQAVISAGGFGKRLRPYTDTMPKPMVPVLGKPMLEWHVEQFKKYGVNEFFLTLHYLPEVVMDYFGDGSRFGVKMHYYIEQEPLGSAGALKKFEKDLHDTFYFIYGDIYSRLDYTKMAEIYATKRDPVGMQTVSLTDSYADADVAELDGEERFVKVHGKPHTEAYPNAYRMRGAFILNKRILSNLEDGVPCELGKELLKRVVEEGENFYGYDSKEYSKGIDTIEKLREVEKYLKAHI